MTTINIDLRAATQEALAEITRQKESNMKLKVFKAPKAETPSPVYLALWQQAERVVVRAVNEFGAPIPGGNLLAFKDDGTITRQGCVEQSLGFKLDGAGRIMFSDMCD